MTTSTYTHKTYRQYLLDSYERNKIIIEKYGMPVVAKPPEEDDKQEMAVKLG